MAEVNVRKFYGNSYLANLSLAKRCLDERCFLKATGYVRQAISADPSRPEAFNLLGVCCEMFRRPLEAQKFYRAALALESSKPGTALWREKLFMLMSRNSRAATDFFGLPPNRVIELGMQIEI